MAEQVHANLPTPFEWKALLYTLKKLIFKCCSKRAFYKKMTPADLTAIIMRYRICGQFSTALDFWPVLYCLLSPSSRKYIRIRTTPIIPARGKILFNDTSGFLKTFLKTFFEDLLKSTINFGSVTLHISIMASDSASYSSIEKILRASVALTIRIENPQTKPT